MTGDPTTPNLADRVRLFFEAANRRDIETVMGAHAADAVYELSQRGLGVFEETATEEQAKPCSAHVTFHQQGARHPKPPKSQRVISDF